MQISLKVIHKSMISTKIRIKRIIEKKKNISVAQIKRIPGGFNCALYKIIDNKKNEYLVKKYIDRSTDTMDRLLVEYPTIMFLWKNKIHEIPEPICMSAADHIGVYAFVKGSKFIKSKYTHLDIRIAAEFWQRIHKLTRLPEAKKLPLAKEACLELQDYIDNVEGRFDLLHSLPRKGELTRLHEFLDTEFTPIYRQIRQFIEVESKRKRINLNSELPIDQRTLSPSDFGFHNAIRKNDGTIIFHDFEYFGWDDPAKMVSDFFLHPRMALPYKYREYFYKNVYNVLSDENLSKRLPYVYMILSFKWCLIMLNIFVHPETLKGKNVLLCRRQLSKAKSHLNEIIAELEMRSFPLSLL
jgi:thiamine kinase-like enzyme